MNKPHVIRRKWAFEKGRNSNSVLIAVLIIASLSAALLLLFEYSYPVPFVSDRDSAVFILHETENPALFEKINRRDPAKSFSGSKNGFANLLENEEYDGKIPEFERLKSSNEFPGNTATAAAENLTAHADSSIPVSVKYPELLPGGKKSVKIRDMRPKIIGQDGRSFTIKALENVSGQTKKPDSIVRISGDGRLLVSRVLVSCGNRELDEHAEKVLKTVNISPGIYIINWSGRGEEK